MIKATAAPLTLFEDYAAQTEAIDEVEIRARVGGILERQAFRDGARVKKGDLLFVVDQQPYIAARQQIQANLGQAQAAYLNSRQNLARLRLLLADQAISQQDLDAAVARERSDAASVEAGQAQLRQAQLNLGYTSIRAPRDGLMGKALIKSGGLVNASTTLLSTLYSINPMYVSFTISEQKLSGLQKQFRRNESGGEAPAFKVRLSDGSAYPHGGKLNFLGTAIDPKNGTLQVRLSLPNPDGELRPGQFVRVIVPVRENPNAIRVPQKAVQELQGQHSVLVVGADNKVAYRSVIASSRVGSDWAVEHGLQPGELVVVEGISKLKPGTVVKPVVAVQQARGPEAASAAQR